MLANMRLCANVPSQHVIQTSLGGYQLLMSSWFPVGVSMNNVSLYEYRKRYSGLNSR